MYIHEVWSISFCSLSFAVTLSNVGGEGCFDLCPSFGSIGKTLLPFSFELSAFLFMRIGEFACRRPEECARFGGEGDRQFSSSCPYCSCCWATSAGQV